MQRCNRFLQMKTIFYKMETTFHQAGTISHKTGTISHKKGNGGMIMKAFLILEDGTVFEGTHIGADREVVSEIVFNTSMAGYLEVLTDPSYAGQAVCMTYPLIGNYGICRDDMESARPWPDALLVRELSRIPSNFRNDCPIQDFLEENGVPGIAGIDTRALTKRLREKGTMNGMITTDGKYSDGKRFVEEVLPRLKAYTTGKVVEKVSCKEKYVVKPVTALEQNGPLSGAARFDREAFGRGEIGRAHV